MSVEKDHVCELKCRLCAVCIHSYTCSCIDSIVRGNLCKHIHAVHMSVNTGGILKRKKESDIINDIVTSDGFADLTATSSSDALEDQLLKNKINTMTSLLEKHEISQNTRKRIGKSIDNIINLICADLKQGNKNNEPPNKKIKFQKRFYSTKKSSLKQQLLSLSQAHHINYPSSIMLIIQITMTILIVKQKIKLMYILNK